MNFRGVIVFGLTVGLAAAMAAQAQPASSASLRASGTVTSVDAANQHFNIKSDKGEELTVTTSDRTVILRVPPGETDVKKASRVTVNEVAPGDRVVAVSKAPITGNEVTASSVLVMSKADVAKEHEEEQEDWKKRGTTGNVTAVDAAAKTVTLKVGARTVTVETSDKTEYHQYAPDSARFSDAKPSDFATIKQGDQMRVLGNKSPDGTVQAEQVVFGAFRQLAATVVSIDAAAGVMTVKDLATKKPLTIKVNSDSTMKKLPEMMAQMLARRYAPGAQQGGDRGGMRGEGGGRGEGRGGGGRGGRGGDIGQMLDNLPAMQLSELKAGDAIMVMTTAGSDSSHVTATMLLAGVEPLLTASPNSTRDIMSGWNLGGGGGGEGQ
jgi:hypothetical protein